MIHDVEIRRLDRRCRFIGLALLALLVAPSHGRASAPPAVPPAPAEVELRCQRAAGGVPEVVLRNRTAQPIEVSLHGLAYAGRGGRWTAPDGIWEPWWVQRAIRLPPGGTWAALIYQTRGEKVEVRDRGGRKLAEFNLRRDLPRMDWGTTVAVHSRADWSPFSRAYRFGHGIADEFAVGRTVSWRTVTPAELPRLAA